MSTSGETKPWNIIIVNQIPEFIDQDKFISIFAKYGTIVDFYFSTGVKSYSDDTYWREFAVIRFKNENEAHQVFEASMMKEIVYNGKILMITLANDDYCPINVLPDLCLREIFLRLDDPEDKLNCELVCTRWKVISKQSWSNITSIEDNKREIDIIERAKKFLRHIKTTIWDAETNVLEYIAENCERLEKFSLSANSYDFNEDICNLRNLIKKNKKLRSIDLHFHGIDFEGEMELTSAFPDNLERFILFMDEVELEMINPLDLSRFSNLQVLILLNAPLQGIALKGIENLVNLKKLKVNASNVDDSEIERITSLTNLEHLAIPDAKISDQVLGKILRNNKKMKYLDISYNPHTTDESFRYVQQLPELRVLLMKELVKVTDCYFGKMPSVKAVSLNFCSLITNEGIKQFLDTAYCIESLYTYGTAVTLDCVSIANEWTRASGKTLTLFLPDDIYDEFEASGITVDDKLDIISWRPDKWYEDPRDDDWSEKMELKSESIPIIDSCHVENVNPEKITIEEELDEQISTNSSSQTESPWNIIIVDNLPHDVNKDEFVSIFSEYGTIQDADVVIRGRAFARVIYSTETEARRVWEASETNPIVYHRSVLIITLASDEYCPIEKLPFDCLLEIFTYVTKVEDKLTLESVSKRWKEISKFSWKTFTELRNVRTAKTIIPRAKKYLRKLNCWIYNGDYDALQLIAMNCSSFKRISIFFDCYDFEKFLELLVTLFRENQHLRYLSLYFERMVIEDTIELEYVSSELRYLKCTTFNASPELRAPTDFSKFRNLEVLILVGASISGADLRKSYENMINLRKLKLYECFTGPEIAGIAELTKLEHLSLDNAHLTDSILEKVLRNNKKLKYLNITKNEKITDASFKYVQQLPQLQVLIIKGLVQVTEKYFAYMPSVKCLNVNGCTMITDEAVERFLETTCSIQWLELTDTRVTIQCLMAGLAWTKCTGKELKLTVNEELEYQYKSLEIEKNEKLFVSSLEDEMDLCEDEIYEGYCEETSTMLEGGD